MAKSLSFCILLSLFSVVLNPADPAWAQGRGFDPGRLNELDSASNPPLAQNQAEKKILGVLNDIRQGPWMANVHTLHGRLLRIFAESTNAKNVVEIGTSNGYSALWICLGLRATGGRLTTLEIDPRTAALARANFKQAGVDHSSPSLKAMPIRPFPGSGIPSISSFWTRIKTATWITSRSCCPWSARAA